MNATDRFIKHALICFGIFFCFTLVAVFSPKIHIGFFGCLALLVSGTFFTTIGVVIGDAVRRFVRPDIMLTSNAVETFQKKVFWMIGPQFIGWFIGLIACNGFMGNVLGYKGLF
jgi:hypothetical protein